VRIASIECRTSARAKILSGRNNAIFGRVKPHKKKQFQ
jgi:hypothetical protein